MEQLALMREEVDRPNLVSDWPAAPHPRSTVHDAVLRNRRARHPDERHTVHPVACELTRRHASARRRRYVVRMKPLASSMLRAPKTRHRSHRRSSRREPKESVHVSGPPRNTARTRERAEP